MNSDKVNQQPSDASGEFQTTLLATNVHFPTLVFRQEILDAHEMNASMLQFILTEREADTAGLQISNVTALGGWHSRKSLHKEAVFKPLVDAIGTAAESIACRLDYDPELSLSLDQMWAVANPPGAFNKEHLHPHSLWSGVYYVQVPDNPGRLLFGDPRPGNIMFSAQHRPGVEKPDEAKLAIAYEPLEGHLTVFPGFLPHSVEPNLSGRTGDAALRVAISFNLAQH